MSRRYISELGERENIEEVYLAADKQLRPNRNGNLYLQLRLSDRSGSVTAMMWNAGDKAYGSFENGDYVRVQGATQYFNGALQLIASRIDRVDRHTVDEAEFIVLRSAEVDRLAARTAEMLRKLSNVHLLNLAECYLMDEAFMAQFTAAPAGIKHHHAYRGGLLEHVVSLMELVEVVAPRYPQIDAELLLMGAFLHDTGKIEELNYERDLSYSDSGQLIGHVVLAVSLLDQKVREAEKLGGEKLPAELVLRLKHMILSHHGQYEFGSPKLPMTLEAIALHHLDNLDARIHSVTQLLREDANADSPWTPFQAALGRKLFKGSGGINGKRS